VKTVLPMTTMEDDSIVEENRTTVVDIAWKIPTDTCVR
jgi:hypothetical protein